MVTKDQCNLEYTGDILDAIEDFLYSNRNESKDNKSLENLEKYVKAEIPAVGDFKLSTYVSNSPEFKDKLQELFEDHELDIKDYIPNITSTIVRTKSNITKNFSSEDIIDLFHTLPLIKSRFDGKVNSSIIRSAFIGGKESKKFVDSDEELSRNLNGLKDSLFIDIQDFLRDKGLLKEPSKSLYNDHGAVESYDRYTKVMNLIDDYFFNNAKDFTLMGSYSSDKKIPNLSFDEHGERIIDAYNNSIFLSNFDSVVSDAFSGIIDINYNMFNDLQSVTNGENKYSKKIQGIRTDYWLKDTEAASGSESSEGKLIKLLVSSIPMLDKNGNDTGTYMEMRDFYLFAARVSDFEIKNGNRLKNQVNSEYKYFNENPSQGLHWYIDEITKAHIGDPNNISVYAEDLNKTFKDNFEFSISLKNFLESEEYNIAEKEKNSDTSITDMLAQVINNNFGASYLKYNADGTYTIQEMYKQNFNNMQVQSMLYSKLSSNTTRDIFNKEIISTSINNLFKDIPESSDIKNIPIIKKIDIGKFIKSKTGISLSYLGIDDLINDLKIHNDNKTVTVNQFRNALNDFLISERNDFEGIKRAVKSHEITKVGYVNDSSISKYIPETTKNNFFIGITNAYLIHTAIKPIMNATMLSGEKLPSFKLANLTHKDTELFELRRNFEKSPENKGKFLFNSLLIKNDPAILGTGTKLEVVNGSSNKKASDLNIAENFQSDFQYDFIENLISDDKNPKFSILLGNYSDKGTMLTKIINGNYKVSPESDPIIKMSVDDILDTLRVQSGNYYKDTINKVLSDYSKLLNIKLDKTDVEKNIKLVNNVISNINPRSLSKKASDLNINLTDELHFSKYGKSYSLNQTLLDNYRIFNNKALFNAFVARQEASMILKFKEFNKSNILMFAGANFNVKKVVNKLGLSDADFDKNADGTINYTKLESNNNRPNPLLRKWMWSNALFRNEYMFISSKGEYMHPHKNKSEIRSGEFNEEYWEKYNKETSGRLSTMSKRNVNFTSTIEVPVRKSKLGIPENVNMAVLEDFKIPLYNISAETKNQDAHDGSSFMNYIYSKMVDSSYPSRGYEGTKKQFASLLTDYGTVIKKDAESVITNDKIRNSKNSIIKFDTKQKQMLGIPIGILNYKFDSSTDNSFKDSFFYNKLGEIYRIDKLLINNSEYTMLTSKKIGEDLWQQSKGVIKGEFNNLYDLWNLFGGAWSVDKDGTFNEGSNDLLYKLVTTPDNNGNYPLKDKMIHVISNLSAVKAGATNVNDKSLWTSPEDLAYYSFKNRFMGPQLDPSHETNESEIKEVSQVMSALSQNSVSSEYAREAYEDIANVIKEAAKPYEKFFKFNQENQEINVSKTDLYKYLSEKFVDTVNHSKGDSIAKVLIESFSKDTNIPFSNQNFYVPFIKDVITRMNNEFISRYYPGTGAVLIPSQGIIQLYDVPIKDAKGLITGYVIATQADLSKEALNNSAFMALHPELTNNSELIDAYILEKLKDVITTRDKIQVGDRVSINGQETLLETPTEYYKFKLSGNPNDSVLKVINKPRDLKPSLHTFNVNGITKNTFDFDSVRLKFHMNDITNQIKSGIKVDKSLEDYKILNRIFFNLSGKEDLVSSMLTNSEEVSKLMHDYLNGWTQRNLELLDDRRIMNPVTSKNIDELFNRDNFTDIYKDAKNYYDDSNSSVISNYAFKKAELVLGDTYQSKFNRDIKDSLYEIKNLGSKYFYDKLEKLFEDDDTEADIRLNVSNLDHPIYIKYTDSLPGNDHSLNIKLQRVLDNTGVSTKFIRYNEKGNAVYTLPDYSKSRVKLVDGKEIIFLKAASNSKIGGKSYLSRELDFNKNLSFLIKSFKDGIQSFIPLMNNSLEGKEVIFDKDRNLVTKNFEINSTTLQQFSKFSGYKAEDYIKLDKDWYSTHKVDILQQLSNKVYASWEKSHEFIASRIPSQSMQSFMPMENVAYQNIKTNDAYVSVWQIWLQGSDFDIDKAYMLGSGFGSNGQMNLWTNITNYSSIEQLNALEKLPIPTGNKSIISPKGANVTKEFIAIANEFNKSNASNLADKREGLRLIMFGQDPIDLEELSSEAINNFNSAIRKVNKYNGLVTIDETNPDISVWQDKFIELLDKHNTYKDYNSDSIKNSIVSRIKQIISMPCNQALANSPIDSALASWHAAADSALKLREKYRPSSKEAWLSPYDMFSYYKQHKDAMVGKDDVGIAANGLKSMFALDSYYNDYYDNNFENNIDEIRRSYKTFRKSFDFINYDGTRIHYEPAAISDVNISKEQTIALQNSLNKSIEVYRTYAALGLSGFTSAATDNAKELLMAKINANTELASMHIYLLTLGLTPKQIADIMTSDVIYDVVDKLDTNIFFDTKIPKVNVILNELGKTEEYKLNAFKSQNLSTLKDIYDGAQELKYLSRLLSSNQRISASTEELNKFLTNFETVVFSRENQLFGKNLSDFKNWKDYNASFDSKKAKSAEISLKKIVNTIFENNGQLDRSLDESYVTNVVKHAMDIEVNYIDKDGKTQRKHVSLAGGNFDFRYYLNNSNKDYRDTTKEYYNLIKNTFNIFDIMETVPHFREMIHGITLSYNMLNNSSIKHNFVHSILKDTIRENADKVLFSDKETNSNIKNLMGNPNLPIPINDSVISKGTLGIDMRMKIAWLKSDGASQLTLNITKLIQEANTMLSKENQIKDYIFYNSDEARSLDINKIKGETSSIKFINGNDPKDSIITLDTNYGIANFKKAMEDVLLPMLQTKSNVLIDALKVQSTPNILGIRGNAITSTIPLTGLVGTIAQVRAQKLMKAFDDLDINADTRSMIKNSNGNTLKWRDLFYTYNLLVNNEKSGDLRLTPLFQNYAKEKDSLGYDYIKFCEKIDSGEVNLFDYMSNLEKDPDYINADSKSKLEMEAKAKREMINDVLFYAFNDKGSLSIHTPINANYSLSVNNPDFVAVDSLTETPEHKKTWKEMSDVINLIKKRGYIIKFEC